MREVPSISVFIRRAVAAIALIGLTAPLIGLIAPRAQADTMSAMQQELQKLTQAFLSCPDDACRFRVQTEMTALAQRIGEEASKAAGTAAAPAAPGGMTLPEAGPVDPKGGRWQLHLETRWRTDAPGVYVRSEVTGTTQLEADGKGVLTGQAALEAMVVLSDPPGCQSDPLYGTGTAQLGGLVDGDFIWLWIVPGPEIATGGRTVCTVNGKSTVHETEIILHPATEFVLSMPVLLRSGPGDVLYTTGNTRGVPSGPPGAPLGAWERVLVLSELQPPQQKPSPPTAEPVSDWVLEHQFALSGHQHRGEVPFSIPLKESPEPRDVRGVGPLDIEGTGLNATGRLILNGRSDGETLSFIPRAVLDDIKEPGTAMENIGQMYFNVLFHPGDQRVTLPLRDGATVKQGPATWTLHGPSNCKLTITGPKSGEKFRYSEADPGELRLTFKAKVEPAKYAKDILWKVPKLGAADIALNPPDAKGGDLVVEASGLPDHNSFFGKKSFVAKIRTKECYATAAREVQLFFPRDATNNPGTNPGDANVNFQKGFPKKVPNWFHYWSQTPAKSGPDPTYGARSDSCKKKASRTDPHTAGFYRWSYGHGFPNWYHICDLTGLGPDMPMSVTIWTLVKVGKCNATTSQEQISTTGIDTFAVVSRHEDMHRSLTRLWWIAPSGALIDGRFDKDLDNDGVPDAFELSFSHKKSLELGMPNTCYAPILNKDAKTTWQDISDDEFYIQYVAHPDFKTMKGSFDDLDWAYPGKQWKK